MESASPSAYSPPMGPLAYRAICDATPNIWFRAMETSQTCSCWLYMRRSAGADAVVMTHEAVKGKHPVSQPGVRGIPAPEALGAIAAQGRRHRHHHQQSRPPPPKAGDGSERPGNFPQARGKGTGLRDSAHAAQQQRTVPEQFLKIVPCPPLAPAGPSSFC